VLFPWKRKTRSGSGGWAWLARFRPGAVKPAVTALAPAGEAPISIPEKQDVRLHVAP